MEKWRKLIEEMFPGDHLSVFNLLGIGAAEVVGRGSRSGPATT